MTRPFSPCPPQNRACMLSMHVARQCLPHRSMVNILSVVALYISYTSLSACPRHLPGLALSPAFPASLVGRHSHDYYPGSVTLALSGCRPSHVP
jgi:hypothetical protein